MLHTWNQYYVNAGLFFKVENRKVDKYIDKWGERE